MLSERIETPLGALVLTEEGGAIVALDWAAGEVPAEDAERGRSPLLTAARAALAGYFAGRSARFDLPLAPRGTSFQRRVWEALCTIPPGEVRTYGELARRLGTSPRAVGRANAANPLPLLIPCHRVVAEAGPGGYSGGDGLATKVWLLEHERRHFARPQPAGGGGRSGAGDPAGRPPARV